nr:glycosyltransferase family 2 protein [Streptomyces sp. PTY087I2]
MPEVPDVSVVIPAHNRPDELLRTLRSLTFQSLPADAFEVIVVDDGSRDDMAALCEAERGLADAIDLRVVRNPESLGAAGARNRGAALAAGKVLVFLDVDCVAHPDLLTAHLAAQATRPIAACGYTYGRELTPETWALRVGAAWDWHAIDEVFTRAESHEVLRDPLDELLSPDSHGAWAFFWTHNVSVPRDAFHTVGGFDESFPVKGVEDMELGLRLGLAGLATRFVPTARALHQPHERARHRDLLRDRRNEFLLFTRHPLFEVEAVCSFDLLNARTVIPALDAFTARLDPRSLDTARLSALPAATKAIAEAERTVLIGSSAAWPRDLPRPAWTVGPTEASSADTSYRLIGTRLPLADRQADLAVITDYWRALPEATACRVLDEALRCAARVMVLCDVSTAPHRSPDPELSAALGPGDRPYWEHTVAVPREFQQFRFIGLDRAEPPQEHAGASRSFEIEAVDWPLTRLSDLTAHRTE